jgi:GNAT superfamily N-acetyltransferase
MTEDDAIVLNATNMALYGFARFHFPGEESLVDRVWKRPVVLSRDRDPVHKKTHILITESQLIQLSSKPYLKLIACEDFSISAQKNQIGAMQLLSERAGWNQSAEDLRAFVGLAPDGNFLAALQVDGFRIPLGSGAVFPIGSKLSWIGMILVHPELRRQGVASAIMEKCVAFARLSANTPVLGLDATPLGMQIYTSLGFRKSFRIWRCTMSTHNKTIAVDDSQFKPIEQAPLWVKYASARGFSVKTPLLTMLATLYPSGCFVRMADAGATGFIMSRPGRLMPFVGPLMADTEEDARLLLNRCLKHWSERGYSEVFFDSPECHFKMRTADSYPGQHRLDPSLIAVREFARMYQLISRDDKARLAEKNTRAGEMGRVWADCGRVCTHAANSYETSLNYAEREREQVLPYLYGTAGPEIS